MSLSDGRSWIDLCGFDALSNGTLNVFIKSSMLMDVAKQFNHLSQISTLS